MYSFVRSSLLLFCTYSVGCVRPHLYPVCFYQAAPTQERVQEYYGPRLVSALQAALDDSSRAQVMLTPDARWLVANVTNRRNRRVAEAWSRIACIGNALDSPGTKQEKDCVAYVRRFVLSNNYAIFGNAKDAGQFDIWNESPVKNTLVHCHELKEDEQ